VALAARRTPLTHLARAAVQSGKDIKSSKTARDRIEAQRLKSKSKHTAVSSGAAGEVKPGEAEPKRARRARPVFEHAPTVGKNIPSFGSALLLKAAVDAAAVPRSPASLVSHPVALDLSSPFLVTDPELALVAEQPAVKSALLTFSNMWKSSVLRSNPGRALQKLVPDSDVAAAVAQELTKCCSSLALPLPANEDAPQLLASLAPGIFAIAFGTEAAITEKDALSSFRLTVSGTRMVVLMPAPWALNSLLRVDATKPEAMQRMCQAALNMTQEKVIEASRAGQLWYATIGPGDLLYTPAGWLSCEQAAGTSAGGRPRDVQASAQEQ
jgi:hypothetical protein